MNTKTMRVNELIKEHYPVFETEKEIIVQNEKELETLLLELEQGYEQMVEDYLIKYDKKIKQFIELESPFKEQTKIKAQNSYVIGCLRKALINHKKLTKNLIYTYLWAYKRRTTDTSHYYD